MCKKMRNIDPRWSEKETSHYGGSTLKKKKIFSFKLLKNNSKFTHEINNWSYDFRKLSKFKKIVNSVEKVTQKTFVKKVFQEKTDPSF